MLSIRNLEVSYGDYQVIRGVSMEVHVGEIVALLGPNGAGKSTILNSISGLQSAQAGVIEFDGVHIESMPSHKIVRLRLAHILERRRVFPYLTVYQN